MTRRTRINIYKICCAVFAIVLLFLPYRGMPYADIRVVATVLGVDGESGRIEVTAQLAVPVSQNGDGKASTVAKAKGGSLSEALENLETGLGRRVDYGHLSTVAIGEGMALGDITEHVSYLMSSSKIGPGAYLVYCSSGTAGRFISDAQDMGESSDAELGTLISYSKSGNHVSTITALRFLQTLNSDSHAAFMPCVELENDEEESEPASGGKSEDEKSGGGSGDAGGSGGGKQHKKLVAVNKIALFGGDYTHAVLPSESIARGIVWQDKKSDFGLVELRKAVIDGEEINSISTRITEKKVRRRVKRENGENIFTYKIKLNVRLDDSRICGNPLFYDKWRSTLEEQFESAIKNSLLGAVTYSKEQNLDFLGIKETFRKFCREGYDEFDLASVRTEVEAKVTVRT